MSKRIGDIGEDAATIYLQKHGFKIIKRNFFSRYGEIDIIAEKGKYIVFVEVKTRKENAKLKACEALTYSKRNKIIKTTMIYLLENPVDLQPRFDFIEVETDKFTGDVKFIDHIENAFLVEDSYETF